MATKKALGGERLGSGKKNDVELSGYERSTHDLSYTWRSTASSGTLIPCMKILAQPDDDFDISIDMDIMTHPTLGPLLATYKAQVDVFTADLRLYQGLLHQNKIDIGNHMERVPLPQIQLFAVQSQIEDNVDNQQINPSALLSYLNIRGVGWVNSGEELYDRNFNAVPFLAYFDIFKNYYSNKQEPNAYQVYTQPASGLTNITSITIDGNIVTENVQTDTINITNNADIDIVFTGPALPQDWEILFYTSQGIKNLQAVGRPIITTVSPALYQWKFEITGPITINGWRYLGQNEQIDNQPVLKAFPLSTIDDMKEEILRATQVDSVFIVNDHTTVDDPYYNVLTWLNNNSPYLQSQQGLLVKTYQSDLFNNWLNTDAIDGVDGINQVTKVSTTGDAFTIDALRLAEKVNKMLNKILVAGGTYSDWIEAVYDTETYGKPETPVYHGSLIKELVFGTVVSNSASQDSAGTQPLGTLAGKGQMAHKHKGGRIHIKTKEHCYIIAIFSLTPRIDYSQGNDWDTHLETMNDIHKPDLDQIGFQELITEQMHWADTRYSGTGSTWITRSAGKQPAWINYMTSIPRTYGNFAVFNNEMFMTLNRQYTFGDIGGGTLAITDLTTYIEPLKYNSIFADTNLDAQNFWVQIAFNIEARRKMSAKVMPNL